MPLILVVAKMAKNGRRRQDVHPKKKTSTPIITDNLRIEKSKQKTSDKKSRMRERLIKYANDDSFNHHSSNHSSPASVKFDTYISFLRSHVLDLHHAEFTARL